MPRLVRVMPVTLWPSVHNARTSGRPMAPVAPATNIFMTASRLPCFARENPDFIVDSAVDSIHTDAVPALGSAGGDRHVRHSTRQGQCLPRAPSGAAHLYRGQRLG